MTRIALIALALALAGELSTIFWIPKLEQPIQFDHGRICTPAMMPSPCAPRSSPAPVHPALITRRPK